MSGEFCGLQGCNCPDPVGDMIQEWLVPTTRDRNGTPRGNLTFGTREDAERWRDEYLPEAKVIYTHWLSPYEPDVTIDPESGHFSCCGANGLGFEDHAPGCGHG